MRIGIPKECKEGEVRVAATPSLVGALIEAGASLFVEKGAGERVGFPDALYQEIGATIVSSAKEVYQADCIVKVKEPQPEEYALLRKGQILLSFLHLAAELELAEILLEKQIIAIAYETVTDRLGRLPLLTPMSAIAGRLATQVGATFLQTDHGGKGCLLGGIPGVRPANVAIMGGGIVGTEAARVALGLEAAVSVVDRDLVRLRELNSLYPSLQCIHAHPWTIERVVSAADLLVGAILVPGRRAPHVVTREMVQQMEKGSVIIDVAVDQGGCIATTHPTDLSAPMYREEGVLHVCATNLPALCGRTATEALSQALYKPILAIASRGVVAAMQADEGLAAGLNLCYGFVTHPAIAEEMQRSYTPPEKALSQVAHER